MIRVQAENADKAMRYGFDSDDLAIEQLVTSKACQIYSYRFVVNPCAV